MKITILVDDKKGTCPAEHGFSALIEGDEKVLFDTGSSDLFIKNAKQLGIDLGDVDTVVLSHGHHDHGEGLKYLKDKTLVCHPACFTRRYRDRDNEFNGIPILQKEAEKQFTLKLTKEPYNISETMIFLGEVPRLNDFEAKTSPFYQEGGDEDYKDDFIMDDSALAIKTNKGLVIITGCGHAGLCNTIEYAKKVTGIKTIHAVLGGFHLRETDDIMDKTFEYLKSENIPFIYTGHCTIPEIQDKMVTELNAKKLESGMAINL